jgi:two-component system sensor histidine kinase PilS (NtrC family)
LVFRLVLHNAAVIAVGALSLAFSQQSRQAGEQLVRQQKVAGDLASLHENTIRCLPSGLMTVDPHGLVTSMNEAACEILGLEVKDAIGRPLATQIPGMSRLLEEAGPIGQVRRQELEAARPDGTVRRLGISATPMTNHQGKVIGRVIHFQDLTELRRMEAAVARSERLASIGRLAAGVAHEIRNPLASISGSVELLKTLPEADEDTRRLIDITTREVDRLNELITSLLHYARPPETEQTEFELADLVDDVVLAFERGLGRNEVRIHTQMDAVGTIRGAPGAIRQVLWNLLKNAEEAMPQGGDIRVSLSCEELTTGLRDVVLCIADTGQGIAPAIQEQIFEPFFTQGKASGTGLGLAMVARILEDHRSTIEVDSAASHGTTFTLRFPSAEAALAPLPKAKDIGKSDR